MKVERKYSVDSIKDVKAKLRNPGYNLLESYTSDGFLPLEYLPFTTQDCGIIIEYQNSIVDDMVEALINNPTEFEAGLILYEALAHLTPVQAADIGFWTYLNHNVFYGYVAARWGNIWDDQFNPSNIGNYIINHWIQTNSSQPDLIKYPLSGLWWSFRLTVDNSRDDWYELTRLFFKNYTMRVIHMGQTKFARHKPAILGVLEYIKESEAESGSLESAARSIVSYVNQLGGIRPLSYFDKDWFKEKLKVRFGDKFNER